MNQREKGRRRDELILGMIDRFGCASTPQVCRALFSGKTAMQSCQRRLGLLTERGLLHRQRLEPGSPYVYSRGRVSQHLHRLAVVEVYLTCLRERRKDERIEFIPEYVLSGGDRADALIWWQTPTVDYIAFLEVQRTGYARLSKYVRYLLSDQWRSEEWGKVFPRVIVSGRMKKPPARLTVTELRGSVREAMFRCQLGAKLPVEISRQTH